MSDEYCAICSDQIELSEKHTMPCDHIFHEECIMKWINQNTIDMNKSGNNYFSTALIHDDAHDNMTAILGLYNSGEFPCPMCKKLYTTLTPQVYQCNNDNPEISKSIKYSPYIVKIKYALDGFDFNMIWMSQYFSDDITLLSNIFPDAIFENPHGVDKLIILSLTKMATQMKHICDKNISEKNNITFHVINCNCCVESCLGYLFVPENLCPCCDKNIGNLMAVPHHFEHCSINQMKVHQKKFNDYVKKCSREYFTEELSNAVNLDCASSCSDSSAKSSDSEESSEEESKNSSIPNRHMTTPGRGHGRGRDRGRGRGRGRIRNK